MILATLGCIVLLALGLGFLAEGYDDLGRAFSVLAGVSAGAILLLAVV